MGIVRRIRAMMYDFRLMKGEEESAGYIRIPCYLREGFKRKRTNKEREERNKEFQFCLGFFAFGHREARDDHDYSETEQCQTVLGHRIRC